MQSFHSPCLKKHRCKITGFTRNTRKGKSQFGLLPVPSLFFPSRFPRKTGTTVPFKVKVQCIRMSYFTTVFLSGKEEESSLEKL